MQEMGEVREPMARDCWQQAQELATNYAAVFKRDFWILYAAKPHAYHMNALVAAWEIVPIRPPAAVLGILVFKWNASEKKLEIEPSLCMPYDIPLHGVELSEKSEDLVPSVAEAAENSQAVMLA